MAQRVFAVTGANKGIGFETVRALGKIFKDGDATIILCSRDAGRGQEAITKLQKEGVKANLELLDITDENSRKGLYNAFQTRYKNLHCLINNAGIAAPPGSKQSRTEQARAICAVNYYGTRDITLSLAPFLRPNSKVVFVAGRLGETALKSMSEQNRKLLTAATATLKDVDKAVDEYVRVAPNWKQNGWPPMPYAFSKAAVLGLTAALARQVDEGALCPKAYGVVVTACCPGWCKTDLGGCGAAPLSAADGARVVVQLALGAGRKEHGKMLVEGRDIFVPPKL